MRVSTAFKVVLLLSASTGCSRTPEPQSAPSATTMVLAAPAPTSSVLVGPTNTAQAVETDAIRSQSDCPERMIFIPGGTLQFTGLLPGDKDPSPKKQSYEVKPFCIDQFEAPDAYKLGGLVLSYVAVEGNCGKRDRECLRSMRFGGPAACVTPEQAECYCASILPDTPKRLPTDQEFLFAALGTDGRLFPWGNALYPDEKWGAAPDFCSFEPNIEPKTHICAPWQNKRDRSPFGVIGLATNGFELVTVKFDSAYRYVSRGVNHDSAGLAPKELELVRGVTLLNGSTRVSPFRSFRCAVARRVGTAR